MTNEGLDTPLKGRVIKCDSYDDCAAVRAADGILSGIDKSAYAPHQLTQLAKLLEHYGCNEEVSELKARAEATPTTE